MKPYIFAIGLLATNTAVCARPPFPAARINAINLQKRHEHDKYHCVRGKEDDDHKEKLVKTNHTPTTRYYEFNVTQMPGAPDGYQRTMLVVNGQYPGPLIECNSGDRLVVKVNNQLDQRTAIHWHGIWQNGTNWMDGATGVTQCAIPSGGSFTYNFTVPYQHGTFWWHSHVTGQYADGILGPLILHDPNEGLADEYDEDVIVMITDRVESKH